MPLWTLPPMPGFTKILFVVSAITLVFGLSAYIVERRKELKRERAVAGQSRG